MHWDIETNDGYLKLSQTGPPFAWLLFSSKNVIDLIVFTGAIPRGKIKIERNPL